MVATLRDCAQVVTEIAHLTLFVLEEDARAFVMELVDQIHSAPSRIENQSAPAQLSLRHIHLLTKAVSGLLLDAPMTLNAWEMSALRDNVLVS
jgi:hypothetical protein